MGEEFPAFRYDAGLANQIERKWQRRWAEECTFASPNPSGPLSAGFEAGRPKFYVADMFPYPSGAGLHVGHPLGYISTDVVARYKRMTGHHVLHTFGYDVFGLPAEQYAIETGQHPKVTTQRNVLAMRDQLRRLGLGHDPRREITTADPAYYRWTQWMFLRMWHSWADERTGRARPVEELVAEFESGERPVPGGRAWAELTAVERRRVIDGHRLAYISEEPVNWCPGLGTVLANEELTEEGRSDVGNHPVYRRPMRQWMLRISAYARRLAVDLDLVDWSGSMKQIQRNWIGIAENGSCRLHDWLFSRQRYWGEPFPIVYDDEEMPVALPDELLPVTLPEMTDFRPVPGEESVPVPPLGRVKEWATVELDLGEGPRAYRRELNTMPQWAGSCWYFLRYLDPANDRAFADPEIERYWMAPPDGAPSGGVDLYVGGVEHGVLHLLYARFWHKVLYDLGHVSTPEPFRNLFNQGYIQADAFTDERGMYVPAAEVTEAPDGSQSHQGRPVTRRTGKMGKSRKNSVSPDFMYDRYGADTLRLYEMAMGPLDVDRPWRTDDVTGVFRFLQRLWRGIVDETTGETRISDGDLDDETLRLLHRTIGIVRADFEAMRFNTAVARLITLTSHAARIAARDGALPRRLAEPMVLMVAPLAPHIAEELWQRLGHDDSLTYVPFPEADPALAAEELVTMPVQINGKTRFTIEVAAGAPEPAIERAVREHPDFAACASDAPVQRVIIVPGRIVNLVI